MHLKDRVQGGGTVPLGEGAVDFRGVFRALGDVGYRGAVVVQGAPGADYLERAERYRHFVAAAAAGAAPVPSA